MYSGFPWCKKMTCWNCTGPGHTHASCCVPLDPIMIESRNLAYFDNKNRAKDRKRNELKRVLFEMVHGMKELGILKTGAMQIYSSDEDALVMFRVSDSICG